MKKLYQKYCKDAARPEDVNDIDVEQEYARQREYLERTVASLRYKFHKDSGLHRLDNVRIMQENVSLIKEINQLRRNITTVKQKEKLLEGKQIMNERKLMTFFSLPKKQKKTNILIEIQDNSLLPPIDNTPIVP